MNHRHVKYLLIGGGLASSAAAEAIRQLDPAGSMLLVGQEILRPYHRPPLSKAFLLRNTAREEMFATPAGWFVERGIELRTGVRVVGLDTARQAAQLDDGQEVSFDRALIAIGMVPRHLGIPGSDFPNIQYLRTIPDAERLHHLVHKALAEGRKHPRGRGKVAVIGGGLLGVELAASLTRLGLEATLIDGRPHPWGKFAGEATGKFLARYLEKHGVIVRAGYRPLRLEGDGRAQRVALAGDEAPADCDFVVAAVGVAINKELLRGTPILVEKAILTDDHCQTNAPGVYAAGDCAAVFDPLFAKHRVMDHWDSARETGALAGRNMAGADEAYAGVSTFSTGVFDLNMTAWGEAKLVARRLWRGTPNVEAPDFVEVGIDAENRVCQVLAVNHASEHDLLRELVRRRARIDGHEEMLKDPKSDFGSLLGG